MAIGVRLGGTDDVDAPVSVYERSNLARRHGDWPSRPDRLAHVEASLRDADSWFLIGLDGGEAVAMASVLPFRSDGGIGSVVPETSFLDLIYVLPARWGEGIGGVMLDAVIEEAARRGSPRIALWTNEHDNARAHRLYLSRGFRRTGATDSAETQAAVAEWLRDG